MNQKLQTDAGSALAGAEQVIFKPAEPPEENRYPGFSPTTERGNGIVIERDAEVSLRDGTTIYADIYRPDVEAEVPALVGWSPYGKHIPRTLAMVEQVLGEHGSTGVVLNRLSAHTAWEAPDPGYWCPRGYAIVLPDPRGSWNSEGDLTFFSRQEAQDEYDLIEWLAGRTWCNGSIGLTGVSYLGTSQWFVAAEQPPHLAAINVWEGLSDVYRELFFHGGIPEIGFTTGWQKTAVSWGRGQVEDVRATCEAHPLLDEHWQARQIDFSKISVPAYVVAAWSDHGLHTRGTLEAYKAIASEHKWLRVHGGKKWADYYSERNLQDQLAFFDRFLKQKDSDTESWPKVRLEVRDRYLDNEPWEEPSYPLERTDHRPLYLDSSTGRLTESAVEHEENISYSAEEGGAAKFSFTFQEETMLVGHAKLKLWLEVDGAADADLFVVLEKLDAYGQPVTFPGGLGMRDDGPVAQGWLRASHRHLDPELSTPQQPWHTHDREQPLSPGEVVPIEIEIWPSGTRFGAGETLKLIVQGRDARTYPAPPFSFHGSDRNRGRHIIHTGGERDSHLLLPYVTRPPARTP